MTILGGPDRQVARATRLVPSIVLDGATYTHAVVFQNDCRFPESLMQLGEWQVHEVDGDWLVLERGIQRGSFVIPPEAPGRGSTEVVYSSVAGGNACDSFERDRVYSPFNDPMAARGSLAGTRLIPGDGVRIRKGSKRPVLEVVAAEAYAVAPSEVNYAAQILGLTAYSENPGTGLGVNIPEIPEGSVPELVGVLAWSGDSEDAVVGLSRRVFAGDPEEMPPGMTLEAGEYYWNPRDYSVRFANGTDEGLPVRFLVHWLMGDADLGILGEVGSEQKLSRGNGAGSFAGWAVEAGDLDRSLELFGKGRVHLQIPGGRGVYLDLGESGVIEAGYRANDGDAWSDAEFDFSSAVVAYPLTVRFRRDGARVRVDLGAENVLDEASGPKGGLVLGVGGDGDGCAWIGKDDSAERDFHLFGSGEFGVLRVVERTLQPASEIRIPGGYVVTAVRNESAQAEMVAGAAGRLGYVVGDQVLTFRREAEGDLVRVTLEPTGGGPPAPGLAFRIFDGQEGFSEIDGAAQAATGLPIATTTVGTNRANWHDRIQVANPFGVDVAPGDIVEGFRSIGFAPAGAAATFAVDELGNEESDWAAIAEADHRWNAYAGILLLRDTLELPDEFCVRGTFARRYRSGHHAEYFEEVRLQAEALDESWIQPQWTMGTGVAVGFNGSAAQTFGPKGYPERTQEGGCKTYWPEDWVWGASRAVVAGRWVRNNEDTEWLVTSLPYFDTPLNAFDLFLRTAPELNVVENIDNTPLVCTPQIPTRESYWNFVEGEGSVALSPFGVAEGLQNFGSDYPFPDPVSSLVGPFQGRSSQANLGGIRVDPGKLLFRLPRNSSIVAAWIPVKFADLKRRVWEWEGARHWPTGDGWVKIAVNGRVIIWNSVGSAYAAQGPPAEWEPEEFLDYLEGGVGISMDVVGAERDSRRVFRFNNSAFEEFALPSARLVAGGGGIGAAAGSSVASNEWAMVDATALFRRLLSLAPSRAQELFVVPGLGQPTTSQSEDGIGSYLQSLMNSAACSVADDFPDGYVVSGSASGRIHWFDGLELGPPMVRFQIGGGGPVYQRRIPADGLFE